MSAMQTHTTTVTRSEWFNWPDDGSNLYNAQLNHQAIVELDADMRTVLNRHRASAHVKVRDYTTESHVIDVEVDKRDAQKLSQMFADLALQLDDPFDD